MKKGSAGWLIVVLALAVPSVVIYKTWSRMDKARRREMVKKVRLRIPEERLFSTPNPQAGKLSNPIAGQAQPPQAQAPAEAAPTMPPAQPAVAPKEPAASTASEAALPRAMARSAAPEPLRPELAQAAQAAPTAAFRDPTLSPYDQYKIEQLELERKLREQEMRRPRTAAAVIRENEPAIESTVSLEGIFETESGNRAIVNGNMVGEGDMVGKVKVQKITPSGVLFVYRNKRFMKWMGR